MIPNKVTPARNAVGDLGRATSYGMKLELVFRNETDDKSWQQDFFAPIIEACVKAVTDGAKNISLSVNLIGEEESQKLNLEHRGKDKPTNVLSFPLDKESGDFGDIFICLSIAKKEALDENISVEQKLAWLTVHGFLHLSGYDHEKSEKDEKIMFQLEDTILKNLNY